MGFSNSASLTVDDSLIIDNHAGYGGSGLLGGSGGGIHQRRHNPLDN